MTAAPSPGTGPGRPDLTVITTCPTCLQATLTVPSRNGTPVVVDAGPDGKAVRDPDGQWWVAKVWDRWMVVRPEPGEDPPTSGRGGRLREHDCNRRAVDALSEVFTVDVVGTEVVADLPAGFDDTGPPGPAGAVVGVDVATPGLAGLPAPKPAGQVAADGFRRPRSRGRGTEWPACAERLFLTQIPVPWAPPFPAGCVRCGRLTNRVDLDGVGWCGGEPATPEMGMPWWPSANPTTTP